MQKLKILLRRLASAGYDFLVLFAIWVFATGALMPFTGGAIDPPLPYNIPFDLYILGVSFAYLGWFWTHGGQTLGMKAWKLEVVTVDGAPIGFNAALKRFGLALVSWLLLGAGWLWLLFDRDALTFHDRYSGTRVRRVDS
ncbi:MAG: RDD family protein [Gammaproteobacteria bacterium]|nr:RDD family protein [Gammaproteobacteria bacterium]